MEKTLAFFNSKVARAFQDGYGRELIYNSYLIN